MGLIKQIKIGNLEYRNFNIYDKDEIGNFLYPEFQDLENLKNVVIDTFLWKIGRLVLKSAGGKQVDLSASNSKAIVLNVKILNKIAEQIDLDLSSFLTPLELESFNLEVQLAENGYSDSVKLKNTLVSVVDNISKYTERIQRVVNANSVEEVIGILNED